MDCNPGGTRKKEKQEGVYIHIYRRKRKKAHRRNMGHIPTKLENKPIPETRKSTKTEIVWNRKTRRIQKRNNKRGINTGRQQ